MGKVQRKKRVEAAPVSHHARDISGLVLLFLGAAGLLCLFWRQSAPVPLTVYQCLTLLAGAGAYVLPLLLLFIGVMVLRGYTRWQFSHASYGSLLLFLVFVTWRHLLIVPEDAPWGADLAMQGGGAIGWLLALILSPLGRPLSHLALATLAGIAGVLIVDRPVIEIVRLLQDRSRAVGQAAKSRLASIQPEPRSKAREIPTTAAPMIASSAAEERSLRAARVAARALAPPPPTSPQETPHDGEEHPATRSRFANLFNLTRRSRDEMEAPEPPEEPLTQPPPKSEKNGKQGRNGKTAQAEPLPTQILDEAEPQPATTAVISTFVLPPLTLLQEAPAATSRRAPSELTDNVSIIEQTLEQFNIGANVVEVASGPSVTRYEIQLAPGIKVSKIVSLADNLAMSLAAIDVRVEAPIPGKSAIGVEVPNAAPMMVSLRECLDTEEFRNAPSMLTVALGKDVSGQFRYADLCKMPHLLIGGSTNSGKSVCLNALIASLVYRGTPRDVRLLMIDPKRVELSLWDGIPHLMHPVVKDVKQAAGVFRSALKEMDRRYDLFAALGTRNLDGYNQRVPETEKLPYLVLIVDELADLMMQQGPEIETSICRLAQLARATGIHLVIATQRPSVDIITGTIKANIASRIAFAVASQVDSRTILDMTGADRLIGRGDMLFMPIDAAKPMRIQGCYLSESETNTIVDYLKEQEQPTFTFTVSESGASSASGGVGGVDDDVDDQFFEQAVRLVVNNGQASTSMLQRRFRIGYTRAARIVEMMEEKGIVGPLNGAKPRELLVSKDDVERMFRPGGSIPSVDDYEDEG